MKHEPRPTPETLKFYLETKGSPLDKYWSAIGKCEQLERERDEAREELARMQTMAAIVADIIAKRDAMLEAIREASVLITDCSGRASDATIQMHADDHAKGVVDDIWLWSEQALAKLKPYLP